jgi:hypothetical protein
MLLVRQVDGPGFWNQAIQDIHVVQLGLGDNDEGRGYCRADPKAYAAWGLIIDLVVT